MKLFDQIIIGGSFTECEFRNCILIGVRVDDGSIYRGKNYLCKFTDDTYVEKCKNILTRIYDGILINCKNIICIIDKDTEIIRR